MTDATNQFYALIRAIQEENVEQVYLLSYLIMDINHFAQHMTPLVHALVGGNQNIIDILLAHGANINAKNVYDSNLKILLKLYNSTHNAEYWTALQLAITLNINVEQLLPFADVELTPLMYSCILQNADLINILLSAGANMDHPSRWTDQINSLMTPRQYINAQIPEVCGLFGGCELS